MWQWVAGGVEENESIQQAALRESKEELGIQCCDLKIMALESKCSIPKIYFDGNENWSKDTFTVTEHSFAIEIPTNKKLALSAEHTSHQIIKYDELCNFHTWDSNRTAAWELHQRLLTAGVIMR
jgi:dATP pyrophosphohydrolase